MRVEFKTFDPAKVMEEKITAVRRAEGQILALVRELQAKGIYTKVVVVENGNKMTESGSVRDFSVDLSVII
jgi:hypothetical protein